MPIYEYRCLGCQKIFSFLMGVVAAREKPVCPRCGGKKLTKLISRVARVRSKDALLEGLADPGQMGDMEDPKAMAEWARKMGKALGDETGEDFSEEMERALDNPEGTEGDADEE